MAFQDFKYKDCLCDFVQNLESFKGTFLTLIDTVITLLTTVKAGIALFPTDLSDQLTKVGLDFSLEIINLVASKIEAPFLVVDGYFRPYSDCPPLATASKTIHKARDIVLFPADYIRQEIYDFEESLDLESCKIAQLDLLIKQLQDIKDAVEFCGDM